MMTLEEAQQEILRLKDENENLITERDSLKNEVETLQTGSSDKDKEIERLREHNNLLWKRCSTQPTTPVEPPTDPSSGEGEGEEVQVKSLDEIIANID